LTHDDESALPLRVVRVLKHDEEVIFKNRLGFFEADPVP